MNLYHAGLLLSIQFVDDGVNSSFISLLEVLPAYQRRGIGSELLRRMLMKLDNIANIDLTYDAETQPFYERFKMLKSTSMVIRKQINTLPVA